MFIPSSLTALNKRWGTGICCADVACAVERVSTRRLLLRVRRNGVHPRILKLRERRAYVAIADKKTKCFPIANQVYQGIVWGPPSWNVDFRG